MEILHFVFCIFYYIIIIPILFLLFIILYNNIINIVIFSCFTGKIRKCKIYFFSFYLILFKLINSILIVCSFGTNLKTNGCSRVWPDKSIENIQNPNKDSGTAILQIRERKWEWQESVIYTVVIVSYISCRDFGLASSLWSVS